MTAEPAGNEVGGRRDARVEAGAPVLAIACECGSFM